MKLLGLIPALALTACAAQAAPQVAPSAPPAPTPSAEQALPPNWVAMQWLYGSGEGAAMSLQTYRALVHHVTLAIRRKPRFGVVLEPGAPSALSGFAPCGDKPFAVILDADETAIANLGYEYQLALRGKASDGALLDRWQAGARASARAMPGAAQAFAELRKLGVTVIINSNRETPNAAAAAETLALAGLGRFVHRETLYLRGDADGKSGKDGRRLEIARRYCVVAMVGDQLGDFADKFNARDLSPRARRELAADHSGMWGQGWFLLSNPVYGPGVTGSIDEVFEATERWNGEE